MQTTDDTAYAVTIFGIWAPISKAIRMAAPSKQRLLQVCIHIPRVVHHPGLFTAISNKLLNVVGVIMVVRLLL